MARYDAMTIAKWFAAWAESDEGDLSNLKLQKLLYYAQGHYFAANGVPLFSDPIQAWSHGPVVPSVYHSFKRFESGDVVLDKNDPFDWGDVDPETTEFLIDVWETYGAFGAWRLRNMTHAEPPWRESFEDDRRHIEIPRDVIFQYFSERASAS